MSLKRPWWYTTGSQRNPKSCPCTCHELGHRVATKRRGVKSFLGTQHQALHFAGCRHSELTVTTRQVEPHERVAAQRIHEGVIARHKIAAARQRDKAKRRQVTRARQRRERQA